MKVLVSGASGLLGWDVADAFEESGWDVTRLMGRKGVDIVNTAAVAEKVAEERPDVIVHCAGYRDLDDMERNEHEGFALNTLGTRNMALAAKRVGCKLVYISSDTVYDGEKDGGYHEFDAPNPINVYGKSKWMAEQEVRALYDRHFIIRTALLFGYKGHRGNNLIFNVIDNINEGKAVKASKDQFCCPSYTWDLAQAIVAMCDTEYFGTYLVANNGTGSRYDVNKAIAELAGLDAGMVQAVDSTDGKLAKRARNTVFNPIAFPNTFGIEMADWRDALKRCMDEVAKLDSNHGK